VAHEQTQSDENTRRKSDSTEITRELVDELGAKLDEFASDLSEEERNALRAAFALTSRAFRTLVTGVACEGGLRIGIGRSAVTVDSIAGGFASLSDALSAAFCRGGRDNRFSVEGLDVERSSAKSVAAAGSKSVAAWNPWLGGAKSVAAGTNVGAAGAKSVAACRNPALIGAKSVAACRNPALVGAKSVAACRSPWGAAVSNPALVGAKSVAACRSPWGSAVVNPAVVGAKSVAACRQPWGPTVVNPALAGAKSVAACRNPGAFGYY